MARPFRYTFILALVGAGTVLAAVGGWRFARASAPVSGPIVLISVDTLRADHLSIYGNTRVETPAIEALAADGVVFDRAYTHAPSTLPAHAALMTGRLPFRTGVRGNVGYTIGRDETLLAEVLRDRGYATAAIVSSYTLRRDSGIGQGFAFFDDDFLKEPWSGRREELLREGAEAQRIAADWLGSAGTERAFLFLHLNDAHNRDDIRGAGPDGNPTYRSGVEYADHVIGDMMDYLKSNQLYDQSTVILLSDHGEGLGDHGERGHGLLLYDEALRVPLVIKPAASEQGGRRVASLVQLADVMPTIVDLAKAPLPDDVDGRSLAPLLDGSESLAGRLAYSEALYGRLHFRWSELRAITDGSYTFISAPEEELYDLHADPGQTRNIVDETPEVADRLRIALSRLVGSDRIPEPAAVAPEVRLRLAALGDVGAIRDGSGELREGPLPNPRDQTAFVEAYRRAVRQMADGQWPEGLATLERLARRHPDAIDLWHDLAERASRAGRHDLAVEAFRRVAALDGDRHDALLGAAAASLQLRRLDDASRRARSALNALGGERGETAARAHELLARVALQRHDSATAFAHALEGQNADSRLPLLAYVEGRRHFEEGRFAEAAEAFEHAIGTIEKGPASPVLADLYFHAAESLRRLDRTDEAARYYASEIERFPTNTSAWAGLATLEWEAGRHEEAAETVTALVRFVPTADAYHLAARLWTALGDLEQATAMRAEARRLTAAPLEARAVHW